MQRNLNLLIIGVLAVVLALVIWFMQSGGAIKNTNDVGSGELQKVTIAQAFEVFLYAPLYIAKEKGFFKEEGLDVNIVTAGGDEKAFAALVSGDAQFAVGDPTFVAISGEKGRPGKVVAAVLKGVPFWGVTNKNLPVIKSPAELKNYSVATFPAPSTAYTLQKNMFEIGGNKANIKETAFGSLLPALYAKQVDIALELEPNVSMSMQKGTKVVYALNDYYPEFAITGMTVLPEYEKDNKVTIQKMVNALQKSLYFIHNNPEETASILIKQFKDVEPAVAVNAVKNMNSSRVFPLNTKTSVPGWDAAVAERIKTGDLKNKASFSDYVTNEYSVK